MAENREFRVELLRPSKDVVVVVVEGEIDIYTAPRLEEALEEALEGEIRRLAVDMAHVSFIDAAGLGVLVGAVMRLKERGARLPIVGCQARVARAFKLTRLEDVFTFYASREEALAAEG